jgi:uncharacterized protein (DUF302 family)
MTDAATAEAAAARGVVTVPSPFPFATTLDRLRAALRSHGLTLFATIDHAAAAADVGLPLPPTVVLIFGNPGAGTPLMQTTPLLALDLPLKLLVHADAAGRTSVSCDAPDYLADRYGVPPAQAAVLRGVPGLIAAALAD